MPDKNFFRTTQPINILEILKKNVLRHLLNSYSYERFTGLAIYFLTSHPASIENIKVIETAEVRTFFRVFCREFRNGHTHNDQACILCDKSIALKYFCGKWRGPALYHCHCFLWDMAYPIYAGPWLVGIMLAGQLVVDETVYNWRTALNSIKNEVIWSPFYPHPNSIPRKQRQLCKIYKTFNSGIASNSTLNEVLVTALKKTKKVSVSSMLENYNHFKEFGRTVESVVGDMYRSTIEAARRSHVFIQCKQLSERGDKFLNDPSILWDAVNSTLTKTLVNYEGHVVYIKARDSTSYEPISDNLRDSSLFQRSSHLRRFCKRVWDDARLRVNDLSVDTINLMSPDTANSIQSAFKKWGLNNHDIEDINLITYPLRDLDGNIFGGLVCIASVKKIIISRYKNTIKSDITNFYIETLTDIVTILSMVLARNHAELSRIEAWTVRSHELAAPVHAILGYHNNLKYLSINLFHAIRFPDKISKENREDIIKAFDIKFNRLGHLCQLMGRISTSISLDNIGEPRQVDLEKEILLPIVQSLRAYSSFEKQVTINYDNSFRSLTKLWLRKDGIERCLFNLIMNAIKYSDEGTEVYIDLLEEPTDNYYHIHIINQGIGIVPGEEELIFRRFRQGSNIYKVAAHGVGLGLHVARQIAQLHEGNIIVNNGNESRTVFDFYLPRCLRYEPGLWMKGFQ